MSIKFLLFLLAVNVHICYLAEQLSVHSVLVRKVLSLLKKGGYIKYMYYFIHKSRFLVFSTRDCGEPVELLRAGKARNDNKRSFSNENGNREYQVKARWSYYDKNVV